MFAILKNSTKHFYNFFFLKQWWLKKRLFNTKYLWELYHVFSDQVTVSSYGNVLIPSFREQFLLLVHPTMLNLQRWRWTRFVCLFCFLLVLIFETLPTMMLVILLKRKGKKKGQSKRDNTNTDEAQKKKKLKRNPLHKSLKGRTWTNGTASQAS